MLTKCFLLLVAATLIAAHQGRIYGGRNEVIENVPWQISLQQNGRHNCGGSIFNERIIVTAAHCVYNRTTDLLSVRVGSTNHNKGGTVKKIAAIRMHEKYVDSNSPPYDVAVLLLSSPLNLKDNSSARAILLAKNTPAHGAHAIITGWGVTENGVPDILQRADMKIVSRDECQKLFSRSITPDMICAGSPGQNICSSDSGGPLVSNGELVGIVSWGLTQCALPGHPGVYADVAVLHDWIVETADRIQYLE